MNMKALVGDDRHEYFSVMSTVAEIEQAVARRPDRRKIKFARWLHRQVDDRLNDEELMRIAADGALALDKREAEQA